GSTMGLLRRVNTVPALQKHLAHLTRRVIRGCAIATELTYTARLPASAVDGKISHSHPQLEAVVKLIDKLKEADKKRLTQFLQAIDYGSVSSRYPFNTK